MSRRPISTYHNDVVVVAGLPRSGTSLMMQLLECMGVPLLVDGVRAADASNPQGYYEFEPVRSIYRDVGWVPRAVGKAVKVVVPLVTALPDGFRYRVVMMRRPVAQVMRSQDKMLGEGAGQVTPEALNAEIESARDWCRVRPAVRWIEIVYDGEIEQPKETERCLAELSGFLGIAENVIACRSVLKSGTIHVS